MAALDPPEVISSPAGAMILCLPPPPPGRRAHTAALPALPTGPFLPAPHCTLLCRRGLATALQP